MCFFRLRFTHDICFVGLFHSIRFLGFFGRCVIRRLCSLVCFRALRNGSIGLRVFRSFRHFFCHFFRLCSFERFLCAVSLFLGCFIRRIRR